MMKYDDKVTTIRLPREMKVWLKFYAELTNRRQSDIIREAITEKLYELESKVAKERDTK